MKPVTMLGTLVMAAALAAGCSQKQEPAVAAPAAAPVAAAPQSMDGAPGPDAGATLTGAVKETMDAAGYTYVLVAAPVGDAWAAAPQFPVAVGDRVTVHSPMPMPNYHSKTLDRTFEVVYFSGAITPEGEAPEGAAMPAGMGGMPAGMGGSPGGHPGGPMGQAAPDVELTGIAKADGGYTVQELLGNSADHAGKEVLVRGKVVKVNSGILGKNWLHLRDGTGAEGSNDVTVTTQDKATVGDTVLVKGTAATNRDFGYGYNYAFLIEDAAVTVE